MHRIILIVALLMPSFALAQTWTLTPILSAASVAAGGTITVTATFSPSAAISNTALDIEIYDPSTARVAQNWTNAVSFNAGQVVTESLSYTIPAAAAAGAVYTIALGTYSTGGTAAAPTFTNLDWVASAAAFTVNGGSSAPSSAPSSSVYIPQCYPKVQFPPAMVNGTLPAGVSTRYDSYAVWVCNLPTGYVTIATGFASASNVLQAAWQYVFGTWTAAQAQADCATTCSPPTASELAYLQTVIATNRPKAVVAFNGASLTRSVYGLNADGSLNPTPVVGESIQVATACDETIRIPTAPTYFSVAGKPNAAGGMLPMGSYAVCVVSAPIGSN